jgi:Fe2+ transport system protein FeoA
LKNMIALSESEEKKKYVVARITDTQKETVYFLKKLGIVLGEVVVTEKVLPANGGVMIKKGKTLHSLSNKLAGGIFVTPFKEDGK